MRNSPNPKSINSSNKFVGDQTPTSSNATAISASRDLNLRIAMNNYPNSNSKASSTISNFEAIKTKLMDQLFFPYTNHQMNLTLFAEENIKLYKGLLEEIYVLRVRRSESKNQGFPQNKEINQNGKEKMRVRSVNKIPVLTKTKSGVWNGSNLNQADDASSRILGNGGNGPNNPILIREIRVRNQFLKQQIRNFKEKRNQRDTVQIPLMKQKKTEIEQKTKEIEELNHKNQQLKQAKKAGDLFELYEMMCRQCEGLRKVNNELSQDVKKVILQVNKASGREENPNVFLMNIK